jgi:hypothetical protein
MAQRDVIHKDVLKVNTAVEILSQDLINLVSRLLPLSLQQNYFR